jgi:hypothetical protein
MEKEDAGYGVRETGKELRALLIEGPQGGEKRTWPKVGD